MINQCVMRMHFTCMRAYICMYVYVYVYMMLTINIASGSAYPFTGARNRNKSADNSLTFAEIFDSSTKIKLARISSHRPRKFLEGIRSSAGEPRISLEPSTLCARRSRWLGRPVYPDGVGARRRVRGDDDRGGAASHPWARSPSCLSPRCRLQQHPQPPSSSPPLPRSPDLCTPAPNPHRNHPQPSTVLAHLVRMSFRDGFFEKFATKILSFFWHFFETPENIRRVACPFGSSI